MTHQLGFNCQLEMLERRRKKAKTSCKILIILGLFWFLIVYGFHNDNVDLDFGEPLDNAHHDRLKDKSRVPFVKFLNDENFDGESNELKSHEKRVLKEFLDTEEGPFQDVMNVINEKKIASQENKILREFMVPRTIIYRETTNINGEFENEFVEEIFDYPGNVFADNVELEPALPNPQEKLDRMQMDIEQLKKELPPEHVQLLLDEIENKVGEKPDIQADDDFIPQPDEEPDLEEALKKLNPQNLMPIQGPLNQVDIETTLNISEDKNADLELLKNPVESESASKDSTEIKASQKEVLKVDTDEISEKLGEYGKAVTLPNDIPDNIKTLVEQGWKNHEFNEYISSLISPQRDLHDFRSDYCKDAQRNYAPNLPLVSVVIVFYNEAWSTLLRSIYSVLNRTPSQFLKEIILVDDFSDFEHLKTPLDDFVKDFKMVTSYASLNLVLKFPFLASSGS